ncbi:hypothetical protein POTOM_017501 [Populus tomentosa]|uniref:Protein kinase domain-containing protein n=1 Tax=Populus tomentosa TaxID=118781 RepID=A0A8X7ZV23_POPTO|nr:hypothetical protein POTOM_017501 [Populus tomentosa]
MLYNLKNLSLPSNLLEGSIPTTITNCTQLLNIDLSFNRITGKLPQGLGQLYNLTNLFLEPNQMSGEIPADIYSFSNLKISSSAENNFSGILKPGIGKLYNLQILKAGFNSLVGPIPPEIGNLTQLFFLVLSENSFSGHIPPELSKLLEPDAPYDEKKRGRPLFRTNPTFTGSISTSVSKLEMLSVLDLHGNVLNGCIPTNEKHANISKFVIRSLRMLEAAQAIDLSNNNLSGIIPKTLEGCRNLFSLDLLGNKLSGSIPAEALVQMSMLSLTNLSRNDLNGLILEKLAELKHLSTLDLSKNQLEGIIPRSFGNLLSLKHLKLSFNHLEGRVPEEIETLSQLRHRNLVKVLGYAWESAKLKVLVLENMQNGSLKSVIRDPLVDQSRYERINVCVSIASALEDLHSGERLWNSLNSGRSSAGRTAFPHHQLLKAPLAIWHQVWIIDLDGVFGYLGCALEKS